MAKLFCNDDISVVHDAIFTNFFRLEFNPVSVIGFTRNLACLCKSVNDVIKYF